MRKINTLKKNYEFKKVLNNGKYYYGKYIQFFIIKNNKKTNRIGIAVSSKIAKATQRNKVKRIIRENYRILVKDRILKGYDFVFVWNKNKNTKDATYYNVKEDFENIFKRTGILVDEKNINKNDINI
jgi:ribonuclease P protein component